MRAKDLWIECQAFEREQAYEAAQSRLRINMVCREASLAWFLVSRSLRSPPRCSPGLPRRAVCACRRVAAESLGSFLEGAGLPLACAVDARRLLHWARQREAALL